VASGPLAIHGVTRDVRIPFTLLHERRTDAWGNSRIGARGRLVLDRNDYGIRGTAFWNAEFDPGRMAIGDSVTVELLVEAVVSNRDAVQAPRADSLLRAARERGSASAVREYRAAVAADSVLRHGSETMLTNAGRKALQHKEIATAVELFALASELNPTSAMAAAYHGEALRIAGRIPDARTAFQRSLAIDPLNTGALEGLRVIGPG
jgi:tetratricopeptide (TPR) repeat protein